MAGFNIKHWFADGAFRTIIRNSAWLGSSNVVSALLGLLALSCAGKGMTPAMFGVLVIVQSYAKSISDFIKFQTWQLVVQYGTPALTNNNLQQFRNVVSFSFSLDIVSGAVAIVGGIALLPFLSHSLGLDDQSFWLAALYCTLIPSMASSTPTGILRAVDRFDLIAVQQATKPFLRAAGSVVAWYFDFGFAGFVIAWYVSNLVGGTMYWWFAARELRRRNIHNAFKLNLFESARHIKGAWSFVWSTNIAHSIWSARNSCSTVLVGIVLGPAAAGLFKIAMTFFDAAGTPAGLLGKSFYPEVMRLDPRTTRPWLLGVKSGLLAGGIGILVALAVFIVGKPLISLVFGVKYLEAYDLIQVMLGAIVISMLGFLIFIFASYSAQRYLTEAANGTLALDVVLDIVFYKVLIALEMLLPVGLYVSVGVTLGQMYTDSEITAISAAGGSPGRLYKAVLYLAIPLSIFVTLLSMYDRPWAYTQIYQLEQQSQSELDVRQLRAKKFNTNDNGRMILSQTVDQDNNRLTDALIYTSTANRTRIFRARSVDVVDPSPEKPTVMLHNGTAYLLDHQGRDDNEQIYRNLQLHLNPLDQSPNVKRKAKSVTELARSAFPADHAELQWRQSRGLTALLMALLAISLSRVKPRQGRFSTLLPLTLLFIAIFYGGDVCRTLVANGAIPLIPGLWLVPGLMLMGLLMLVARDFSLLQKFSR